MPREITETQRALLERMLAGTTVMTLSGLHWSAFLRNEMSYPIRFDTIAALARNGYIVDISNPKDRWRGSHYRITEAGEKAARL